MRMKICEPVVQMPDDFLGTYTAKEAANAVGISKRGILSAIEKKTLMAHRCSCGAKSWLIVGADLGKWLRQRMTRG